MSQNRSNTPDASRKRGNTALDVGLSLSLGPQSKRVKPDTIPAPYPWATDRRAGIQSMEYILDHGILTVSGEVQCKKCERVQEIEYDVREKFEEVVTFLLANRHVMHNRAPREWNNPTLPTCKFCGLENSCKPVITKKRSINWLFLLLGQLIGCCTLNQLKYFCKHGMVHRTGAKNRVLYLTYVALCKQLEPKGPFDW